MSYAHNDHYKWIESNYNLKCSVIGKEVANILGYVGSGIYNASFDTKKVDWTHPTRIELNWKHPMANWDFCELTKLVIECHRRMIRVQIEPNMRYIKMRFHQRFSRNLKDGFSTCLPDIEDMIRMRDEAYGIKK